MTSLKYVLEFCTMCQSEVMMGVNMQKHILHKVEIR